MRFLLILACLSVANCLPADQDGEHREGRNVIREFLGSVGMLRIIPRACNTDSAFLGKGMCSLQSDCQAVGGAMAGNCERAGVCCVVPAVCGSTVKVKRSWYINREFPQNVANLESSCSLSIVRSDEKIRQVRLDFDHLVLSDATGGECKTDWLKVYVTGFSGLKMALPILCGDNSGQHVYVNMPAGEDSEVRIQVQIGETPSRSDLARGWRIHITQLEESESAPARCLQYYTDATSKVKSLNFGSSQQTFLTNSDYDICFKPLSEFREKSNEALIDTSAFSRCQRVFSKMDLQQSFSASANKALVTRQRRNTESKVASPSIGSDKLSTDVESLISTQINDNEISRLDETLKEQGQFIRNSIGLKDNKVGDDKPENSDASGDEKMESTRVENIFDIVRKMAVDQEINKDKTKVYSSVDSKDKNWVIREDGTLVNKKRDNSKKKASSLTLKEVPQHNQDNIKLLVAVDDKATRSDLHSAAINKKVLNKIVHKYDHSAVPNLDSLVPVRNSIPRLLTEYEANEYIKKDYSCFGSYLLVNDRKVCGSFTHTRSDIANAETNADIEFFKDADKISVRTVKEPETAMRFSIETTVNCRVVTTTTTTVTPQTAAPQVTRSPLVPVLVASNTTDARRVGIVQYLLGWY